jgi:hypothetical protein
MISSIAWVPAGVADPRPKKYELSPAEQELIMLMEEQGHIDDDVAVSKARKPSEPKSKLPIQNTLPADLRMDDYSDDDDEDKAKLGVGRLLLGSDDEECDSENDDDNSNDEEDKESMDKDDDDEGSLPKHSKLEDSDDSDDDLDDVPDTREYMALDVEGLEAMGLSHVGGRGDAMDELGEDDESDAADVEISPDDALLVVGKAEDVSD